MEAFDKELDILNSMTVSSMTDEFKRCCGSSEWSRRMSQSRPFENVDKLMDVANQTWWSLRVEDWMEAFSAHPEIGDKEALRHKFSKSSWEGNEQSGANSASEDVLNGLATLNREYRLKNGFVFLICATGKSAQEMLDAMKVRLQNDNATEIQIAAGEQAKITKLRLVKLLSAFTPTVQSKL